MADLQFDERIEKLVDAATDTKDNRAVIVTSSGAMLRFSPVPSALQLKVHESFKEPKPPIVEIKDESGKVRKEENINDPDYVEKYRDYVNALAEALVKLSLLRAMEIIQLPENISPYDQDKDWEEEMAALGLTAGAGKAAKFLDWCFWRLIPDFDDYVLVQEAVSRTNSVDEEDVDNAERSFPDSGRGSSS